MSEQFYSRSTEDQPQVSPQELNEITFWIKALSMPKEKLADLMDYVGQGRATSRPLQRG